MEKESNTLCQTRDWNENRSEMYGCRIFIINLKVDVIQGRNWEQLRTQIGVKIYLNSFCLIFSMLVVFNFQNKKKIRK